jgi:hypothetical protein
MTQELEKPTNLIRFLFMVGMKKSNIKVVICSINIEVKIINLIKRAKKINQKKMVYIYDSKSNVLLS